MKIIKDTQIEEFGAEYIRRHITQDGYDELNWLKGPLRKIAVLDTLEKDEKLRLEMKYQKLRRDSLFGDCKMGEDDGKKEE